MAKGYSIEKKGNTSLRRAAREVKVYRTLMKVIPLAVGCMSVMVVLVFAASMLYRQYGSFTVNVDLADRSVYALSLSEHPDFNTASERLNFKAGREITNISADDLPLDLDTRDGEHSGDNYVAYTFYAKNVGKEPVKCEWEIYIKSMTMDIEKAVRVRVYTGDVIKSGDPLPPPDARRYTDYARAATDGVGDGTGAEPGTTRFYSSRIICRDTVQDFEVGDMLKYTVVIWLEGDDPDCLDSILGGQFKLDMSVSVSKADKAQ